MSKFNLTMLCCVVVAVALSIGAFIMGAVAYSRTRTLKTDIARTLGEDFGKGIRSIFTRPKAATETEPEWPPAIPSPDPDVKEYRGVRLDMKIQEVRDILGTPMREHETTQDGVKVGLHVYAGIGRVHFRDGRVVSWRAQRPESFEDNWAQLREKMTPKHVIALLGEPKMRKRRTSEKTVSETWNYDRGYVLFFDGELRAWSTPSGYDYP